MNNYLDLGVIHVNNVNLWAHVGVLEKERMTGQRFVADLSLWLDLNDAAKYDDISKSVNYASAVKGLQRLSFSTNCLTIEKFSDKILDLLEELYGPIPMKLLLKKCEPPIEGFTGNVAIERKRNF